eukprot:9237708-Pyramimonas_sp.AAC.1
MHEARVYSNNGPNGCRKGGGTCATDRPAHLPKHRALGSNSGRPLRTHLPAVGAYTKVPITETIHMVQEIWGVECILAASGTGGPVKRSKSSFPF